MDPVSSALTIVATAWTLSVRLRELIDSFKAQEEKVKKLEHKAETLATIIQQVHSACKPHAGANSLPIDADEENIRRTVRNVTSRCRDDLDEFVKVLSKLLAEKKTGRFRMDLVLKTWRMQVAEPTFATIEKSIEGHEFSLQLLLNILHGRSLNATRTVMEAKLNAIHHSNERMLSMLQQLANSPDRLTEQDNPAEIGNGGIRRRDTDATLVGLSSDFVEGDQIVFAEDNSRLLQQIFVRIFAAWLTQISAEKGYSDPLDLPPNLAIPKPDGSTITSGRSPSTSVNYLSAQVSTWAKKDAGPKRPSSPVLGPKDIPSPLSPTRTRSSDVSQFSESPKTSFLSGSAISVSSFSEVPTLNETASRELLEAVTKKDIGWMNMLIDDLHADIEFRDPCDKKKKMMTPLLLAVKLGELEMIKFLLSKGADIEAKDGSGMTPLILSASLDKVDIMKNLLARGADVRAKDTDQRTALHVAIKYKSSTSISFLLQLHSSSTLADHLKPDINAADKSGHTPLHYCAKNDNLEHIARMLLDRDADLEAQDVAKFTAAYYAIQRRKYFVVKLLLERGADFSSQWPPEATSDEIEKLLRRKGWVRPKPIAKMGWKGEKPRGRSKSEIGGMSRRTSFFLPSLMSRRSSAMN